MWPSVLCRSLTHIPEVLYGQFLLLLLLATLVLWVFTNREGYGLVLCRNGERTVPLFRYCGCLDRFACNAMEVLPWPALQ